MLFGGWSKENERPAARNSGRFDAKKKILTASRYMMKRYMMQIWTRICPARNQATNRTSKSDDELKQEKMKQSHVSQFRSNIANMHKPPWPIMLLFAILWNLHAKGSDYPG